MTFSKLTLATMFFIATSTLTAAAVMVNSDATARPPTPTPMHKYFVSVPQEQPIGQLPAKDGSMTLLNQFTWQGQNHLVIEAAEIDALTQALLNQNIRFHTIEPMPTRWGGDAPVSMMPSEKLAFFASLAF